MWTRVFENFSAGIIIRIFRICYHIMQRRQKYKITIMELMSGVTERKFGKKIF